MLAGPLRILAVVVAAVLVLAACGDTTGDEATVQTSSTTMLATDDGSADEGAMDDMTNGDQPNEDEHEHEHDEAGPAFAWDGPEVPQLAVAVSGDPESGWDVAATITGFTFSDPTRTDHVPGEGHTHVFVDGALISMSYEPVVHVPHLEPGDHQAMVTLSRNDHSDYSIDGELIMATATFTVPGVVMDADSAITVMYMDGAVTGVDGRPAVAVGDTVEITVHSDVADLVHVHGYDLFLDLDAGEMDTVRFVADIPGIFEVELEDRGVLLLEFQVS